MAGAHCAAAVTPTYYHFPAARKVPVLACNVSTRFPSSKPSKRKNHLRPKILKTLTKPFLNPELTPTNPFIIQPPLEQLPTEFTVIESNPVEEQAPEFPSDQFCGEDVKFESDPIEQQPPNFASDRFSVEEVKFESDPIEQQPQEILSDQFTGEDVKYTAIESDPIEEKPPEIPSDRFGGEEVKLSELGQQELELLSGEVGDDFKSVELELEFSSDQLAGEEVKNINLVEMQTEMKEFDLVEQQLELSSCDEIKKSDPLEKLPGFEGESSFSDEKTEEVEMAQVSEFSVSETSFGGLENGIAGNYFSTAAFEIGLSFLGACVLHIVSTLWMARSIKSGKKDRKSVFDFSRWNQNNKTRSELQSKEKGNVIGESKNGGVVSADESEMSKKIAQVRELAREARELEKLGSKGNDMKEAEEEDEFDDDDIGESGIRKEVGDELVKLQKNLRDSSKKSSLSPLWERALRWEGKTDDGFDKDGLAAEEASEALIFKKKYRFKSGVIDAKEANKPQGFMGRRDSGVTEIEMTKEMLRNGNSEADELDLSDKVKQIDLPSAHVPESVSKPSVKDNARKLPAEESKRTGSSGKKVVNGRARAKRGVAKSERGLSRKKISNVEAHSSGAVSLENQYVSPVSKSCNDLNVNGSLKNKEGGIVMANRVSDAESYIKPEFWWLSLPYVIAIVMRRGHDGQGPKGLFTLRSSSKDSGHSTFTVAFEDHGEATNVCHILDSFFEELGDFSAEAVPVPVKELEEAVKSQTMKLVVVKKGELQLSAGQPLTDVETALHSLIGPS